MQERPFQIHFSKNFYNQLYDDTERHYFSLQNNKKEIYTLKQKGLKDKKFVAKKYTYKKDKYIDKVWEEVNSVMKVRNHDHPNIIKYHDIFMYDIQQNNKDYQVCIMVMEKGDQTLEEFVTEAYQLKIQHLQETQNNQEESTIKKNKKSYQQQHQDYENLVYQYLKQTLNGCKFLKTKNIYHRDYKPMNLVLLNNQIKIIDYDIAKITQLDITQEMSNIKGTEIYMDPNLNQICKQINYANNEDENPEIRYNLEKMDIYSMGCTFLKLALKWNGYLYRKYYLDATNFFENKQFQEQEVHLQQVISPIQHPQLKYILCNMLILDIKKRWNLKECIEEQKLQQKQQIQQQNQQQQKQCQQLQEQILVQKEVQNNNNKLQWLSNEQIEQLDQEKYTIKDIDSLNQNVPQTRYLEIQIYCLQESFDLANKISKIINNQNELTKLVINYITKQTLEILFPKINNLQNLQIMELNIKEYLNIGENGAVRLAKVLEQLSALQQLHLQFGGVNQIGPNGAASLGQALEQLTSLQQLHLEIGRDNEIGANGAASLAKALEHLTTLQQLELNIEDGNEIGANGAASLAKALEKLTTLQQLHLEIGDGNQIGANGAASLAKALEQLTTLQQLHLEIGDSNKIGANGAASLGKGLEKLTTLQQLHLEIGWGNEIEANGAASLGKALEKLTTLQILHLEIGYNNEIGANGAASLAKALEQLTTLQQLQLNIEDGNEIGANGAASLAKALEKLTLLQYLHLSLELNSIGEDVAISLAKALEKLTLLQQLQLRFLDIFKQPQINQKTVKSIGSSILKLPNLTIIDLQLGCQKFSNILEIQQLF